MTEDLLAFLTARLDETEATARDAGSRSAHAELYVMDDDCYYPLVIGRNAVLADVEAKRAIAALHRLEVREEQRHRFNPYGGEFS